MESDNGSDELFEGFDGRRLVIIFAVVTALAAAFFATSVIDAFTGDADEAPHAPRSSQPVL